MFLYYFLIVVVFLNRVSAFVLVCCWSFGVLGLFLLALTVAVVNTDSSALLEMSLGMCSEIILLHHHDTAFFVTVALFLVSVEIFFPNPVIAQLVSAYERIYNHMVGLARLSHMEIIVETMRSTLGLKPPRYRRCFEVCVVVVVVVVVGVVVGSA